MGFSYGIRDGSGDSKALCRGEIEFNFTHKERSEEGQGAGGYIQDKAGTVHRFSIQSARQQGSAGVYAVDMGTIGNAD